MPVEKRKGKSRARTGKRSWAWDLVWGCLLLVCITGLILLLSTVAPVQKVVPEGPKAEHSPQAKKPSQNGL